LSNRRIQRVAAILFLALCAACYFEINVLEQIPDGGPQDFNVYYHAGQDVADGKTPYGDRGYLYPPLFALLMTPLARLSLIQAQWVWFLCSQVFLLAAAWVVWRAAGRGWIPACIVAFLWACGGAASENIGNGQVGTPIMMLLAIAYSGAGVGQGIAAGASACLKYFPGVLGVVFVLERNWRALAAFAATALAGLLIPWIVVAGFLEGPKSPANPYFWMGTPAILSWSAPSTVLRILDPARTGVPLSNNWLNGNDLGAIHLPIEQRLISVGVAGAVLILGFAAMFVVTRGRVTAPQAVWASAAMISVSLAASPICWTHYQILDYPGAALLLAASIRRRMWPTLGWAIVCLGFTYQIPSPIRRRCCISGRR
jgi:alpha-1,2-mannosyltransferase